MILLDLCAVLDAEGTALVASHMGPTVVTQTQARMWALREYKAVRMRGGENGRSQLKKAWDGEEAN